MSYMHPVYSVVVDCSRLADRAPNHEEAFEFLPAQYLESKGRVVPEGCWSSASHNWWWQVTLRKVCDAYPGHDEAKYLLDTVAILPPQCLNAKIDSISRLIEAIKVNPKPFAKCTTWYGTSEEGILKAEEEVPNGIEEAVVARQLDDDTRLAFGNFFSFLISQIAALQEARACGKCLLYFQPQP